MLDIKRLRSNFEEVKEALGRRSGNYDLEGFLELDTKRR